MKRIMILEHDKVIGTFSKFSILRAMGQIQSVLSSPRLTREGLCFHTSLSTLNQRQVQTIIILEQEPLIWCISDVAQPVPLHVFVESYFSFDDGKDVARNPAPAKAVSSDLAN